MFSRFCVKIWYYIIIERKKIKYKCLIFIWIRIRGDKWGWLFFRVDFKVGIDGVRERIYYERWFNIKVEEYIKSDLLCEV